MSRGVAICGAGNLGRRYLEGILASELIEVVHVYDISEDALRACEKIVRRLGNGHAARSVAQVCLHETIDALPTDLELAIVATSADVRPEVVGQLAAHSRVPHWILEKVLAQDELGLDQLSVATSASLAWVNTPRRMMDWYRRLHRLVRGHRPISMVVSGGAWGLGCNAVHFIDVLAWWSGETPCDIETSALSHEWHPAKRKGFSEVYGSMSVTYTEGSCLTLTASHDPASTGTGTGTGTETETEIEIEVEVGGLTWLIVESEGTARRSDGLELPGRVDLQSEMSAGLADSILTTGTCLLPTLDESISTHRVLLRGLGDHWRRSGGSGNSVPIT